MDFIKIIYLITSILGLTIVFIVSNRYKKNIHINLYIILIFILVSFRFLVYGIFDYSNLQAFVKQINIFIFINVSPLIYLYFKKLSDPKPFNLKNDAPHILMAFLLFIFINFGLQYSDNPFSLRLRFILLIFYNLFYLFISLKQLKRHVWHKKFNIVILKKQNSYIRKWTYILVLFYIIVLLTYIFQFLFLKLNLWHNEYNPKFLWITALIWIILYLKILYSPEFLFGYELFLTKIK